MRSSDFFFPTNFEKKKKVAFCRVSCKLMTSDWRQCDKSNNYLVHKRPPLNSQACSRCYNVIMTTLLQALFPVGTSVELFVYVYREREKKKNQKQEKKNAKLTFHLKHSHSCLVLSPLPPPTPTTSNSHIPKEGTTASKQTHWPREGLSKTTALN